MRHESLARYLCRFVAEANEEEAQRGFDDLRSFLELAKEQSKTALVLQHLEKSEIDKHMANSGYRRIREACKQAGITPVSLEPYFRRSIESGANPYRGNIHPNEVGQRLIAEAIMEGVSRTVSLKGQ